jgi:hypothetical protein
MLGLGGPWGTPSHPKHANSIMTQALPLPPLEVLQEKFDYNPENGLLTYRKKSRSKHPGEIAGYTNGRGWLRVKVDGIHYRVARIVWKMHYGIDPPEGLTIDHINRNRTDNRIANLRAVTQKENVANSAHVLNKKPPEPRKTPEELAEIRKEAAKKISKAIIVRLPSGEEKWYPSLKEAAQLEQIHAGNLSSVLNGRRSTVQGYTARFA